MGSAEVDLSDGRGLAAATEMSVWAKAQNSLDDVYSEYIIPCRKLQLTGKYAQMRLVLENLADKDAPATDAELRNISCKEETEKVMTSLFRSEYTELFGCKSACQNTTDAVLPHSAVS